MEKVSFNILHAIFLLIFSVSFLQAQDDQSIGEPAAFTTGAWLNANNVIPPSPQAASLGRYGNVPVNHYTGAPNVSLPIYNLSGKYLSAPISLMYDAGSIKVNELPSWVGLGWSLQVGGVITRSAKGMPDLPGNYYANNFPLYTENGLPSGTLTWNDLVKGQYQDNILWNRYFYTAAKNDIETQPDVYYFNFPGYSGSFVIMPDKSLVFREYTELEITPQFSSEDLTSFQIRDPQGRYYEFDTHVESTHFRVDREQGFGIPLEPKDYTYNSSWYLKKIISRDGSEEMIFDYKKLTEEFEIPENIKLGASRTYSMVSPGSTNHYCSPFGPTGGTPDDSRVTTIKNRRFLSSITLKIGNTAVERVSFDSRSTNYPGGDDDPIIRKSNGMELNRIQVDRRWQSVDFKKTKVCVLEYGFETGRLTLNELTETGYNQEGDFKDKEPHEFTYGGELPTIPSNAIDHWGYYNGQGNPNELIPGVKIGQNSFGGSANRNAIFFTNGLLQKITYPTGGHSILEFGPHKIPLHVDEEVGDQVGGYRIEKMTDYTKEGEIAQWKTFKYVMEDGSPSGMFLQGGLDYAYYATSSSEHYPAPGVSCFGDGPVTDPICAEYSCPSITVFASSQGPLGSVQGSHIGYSRVEEIIGDPMSPETNTGRTIYTFENDIQPSNSYWENKNGTLLSVEIQDNEENPIRKTENFYDFADCAISGRCINEIGAKIIQKDIQDNKPLLCEISGSQPEWRTRNGTFDEICEPAAIFETKFERRTFSIEQKWKHITSSKTTHYFYDDTGGQVEQEVFYEYNDPNTISPTASYFINTDDDSEVHRTEIEYADVALIKGLPEKVIKKIDGVVTGGTRQEFDGSGRPIKIFEVLKGGTELERAVIGGYTDGRPGTFTYMDFPTDEFIWDKGLLKQRKKDNFIWQYDYNEQRQMIQFTDTDGQIVDYIYDGLQRLEETHARQDNVITTYQYLYRPNQIIEETVFTDAPTQTMISKFDGLGRPTSTTHNDLVKQQYKYDEFGRVFQETYLPGSFKTYEYDESPLNRVIKEIYPGGDFTEQLYASENNLFKNISLDEKGNATAILSDLLGRQFIIKNAEMNTTTFQYDDWGDLESVTTPGQSQYTYNYDSRHRMMTKIIPGSGQYTYTYNDRDELFTSIDPNGNLLTFYYDQYGRDLSTTLANAQANGEILKTVYLPETEGDRVDYTEAAVLNPDGSLGASLRTTYEYDDYYRVEKTTMANYTGNDIMEPTYNMADWVTKNLRTHNGYQVLSITESSDYDKFGRLTALYHDMGTGGKKKISNRSYNDSDQLLENILGDELQWLDYTYNQRGWLEQINDPLGGAAADPLVSCTPPGTDGPFPQTNESVRFFQDISVEDLLRKRFDVHLKVKEEETESVCQPRNCDPPSCTPQEQADQLVCLGEIKERMVDKFSRTKEVPCADGSDEVIHITDLSQETFPIELVRVRLCDGTEQLILENQVVELCGSYAVEQLIQIYSANDQLSVKGPAKFQALTAEELITQILDGQAPIIGSYVPCGGITCFPPDLHCSETEIIVQEASLEQIRANFPNIDLENLTTPITLYEIGTCPQEIFYVLPEELHFIEGTQLVVLDTLFFDSLSQLVPVDIVGGNGPDKCADLFHLKLTYEPNGNVDTKSWQVYGRSRMNYDFVYDDLNRIKEGAFTEETPDGNATDANRYGIPSITYDPDGNIKTLSRRGITGLCSNGLPEYGPIDLLIYRYEEITPNQKNRLKTVTDGSNSPKGFDPGLDPLGDYLYDLNGNLTSDPYKGLTITYNHLNLPSKITKGNDRIEIYYDASGRKLRQEFISTEDAYVQDYMNGIDYRNQELNSIFHAEGRITPGETGWQYEYFLKDHLGNIRLSVSDLNGNGCIEPLAEEPEVLQESHYYPFGLNMDGPWARQYQLEETDENGNGTLDPILDEEGNPVIDQEKLNRYQYNGKELTQDLGLNWNDYGARWYDPAIGRWNAVDPLAEEYSNFSPFNYAVNNPILLIDPDGMSIDVKKLIFNEEGNFNIEGLITLVSMMSDLSSITGMDLEVKGGFLIEGKATAGKNIGTSNTSGSARSLLRGLIQEPSVIEVGTTTGIMGVNDETPNFVEMNLADLDGTQKATSEMGVDSKNVSTGITFLHESLHTKVGHKVMGKKYKYYGHKIDGSSDYRPGRTTSATNRIRGELGLATRVNYYYGKSNWNPGVTWQVGAEKIRVMEHRINHFKAKFEKTTRPTLLKLQPIFNINK